MCRNEEAIMRSALRLTAMMLVAGTLCSTAARADPIALTGGFIDIEVAGAGSAIGVIQLTGDRGFTFVGGMSAGFEPPVGDPLIPGATVTLQASSTGLDLGGTVTLDGVTYTGIGGLDSPVGASLEFVTTATLPSVLSPPSEVTAPFMLDLIFFDGLQSHSLFGSGLATIFLDEDKGFGVPSWRVTGVRADVSSTPGPIPEPATLLLVASGLGWVVLRRRRA